MLKGSDDSQKLIKYCVSCMMEITMLQHKVTQIEHFLSSLMIFKKDAEKILL